jgi:S1-C subfamily serine protease
MSDVLKNLSSDLADVVQTAGASIVRVEARRRMPASGVIWSADGLIVTTHHVVERDENIKIGLPDGKSVSATLVGRDPSTDIAVLRAQASGLTAAEWSDSDSVRVGHLVLAIGRPGNDLQATLGVVSALDEGFRTHAGGLIDRYMQTDVVMYPGFSGGPLVDANGSVLGLNTSALMRGVSLTLPASTIRRVAEMLTSHGKVRQGYLGVKAQPVRLPAALESQLGQETGLLLASVEPDSPAEKGGLMLGDTLVGFGGDRVRHMDDLLAALSGDRVGKSFPAKVVRGGQVIEATVAVGERE